ncbi:DUF1674 domain-containing protein [Halofilum ochraceum]|uniref:DUF1674 domain-containing protein n=1 Tax=Halofilum ochraceum TaxID=1611323 RepID=UPI0009F31763|nr:succinate dehydrogenase assembly factor 4 [Halofilum ochraceum]
MLFTAACKAECFDKGDANVNNEPPTRSGSFDVTESESRKPAENDTSRSPGTPDGRTDSGDQTDGRRQPRESGGPKGLEPTRYGDWERNGRCTDF